MTDPILVSKLADAFCIELRETLTAEEMAEVVSLNKSAGNDNGCATHDFCDSNVVMADAMQKVVPGVADEFDAASDEHAALWNAAWDKAKAADFSLPVMPVVTLKSLKYAEFASEETACYQATVYVDGERLCTASNDGHGGADEYDPIKGQTHTKLHERIEEIARRVNPSVFLGHSDKPDQTDEEHAAYMAQWRKALDSDAGRAHWLRTDPRATALGTFESLVADALTDALVLKDVKKAMRGKVLFTKPDEAGLWEIRIRKGMTAAETIELMRKRETPVAVFLNELSDSDAVALYRSLQS